MVVPACSTATSCTSLYKTNPYNTSMLSGIIIRYSAVLLHHSDSSGAGVCLPSLAHKSCCRADEGTGVAAAQRIIYEEDDYTMSLIQAELVTLESRCEELTKRFFKRSVMPNTSCLHYLLPDKCDVSITGRLRHARTFEPLKSRTIKFRNSLIPYCLDRYV